MQGLPLTDANYAHARKLLEDRYGKTQVIISAHVDNLIKLNPCANDKPNKLRYMFDQIRVQIRGLESLGVKTESYGQLLIPIIMSKLPSEIRLQVSRATEKEVWEIQELLDLIQKEIEARETTEQVKVTMEQRIKQGSDGFSHQGNYYEKPFNPQFNNNLSTGAALFTRSRGNDSRSNSTIVCVYCGQTHFSTSCENVRDISHRKNILLRDRHRFVCLKVGHRSKEYKCRDNAETVATTTINQSVKESITRQTIQALGGGMTMVLTERELSHQNHQKQENDKMGENLKTGEQIRTVTGTVKADFLS